MDTMAASEAATDDPIISAGTGLANVNTRLMLA